MGQTIGIVEIVHWMSLLFPSLSQYIKIVAPLIVVIASVVGIFSNILPEPGKLYPIPELEDIKVEIKPRSRLVYLFTRVTRRVAILTNQLIVTKPYKWFYVTTKFLSNLINRLKGIKIKSDKISITTPKPYKIKLDRFRKKP